MMLRVLVGVTADSMPETAARVRANARHLRSSAPAVHADWAACIWDGPGTEAWQRLARELPLRLYAAESAAEASAPRRRALKLAQQLRLLPLLQSSRFDALWLLDGDMDLDGFDGEGFWSRWRSALAAAGPPLIAQPVIARGARKKGGACNAPKRNCRHDCCSPQQLSMHAAMISPRRNASVGIGRSVQGIAGSPEA